MTTMYKIHANEPFTRLTLEKSDKKFVWEVPYEDVDATDDMMQAIYTVMIGMGFHPDTVLTAMGNFINERSDNLKTIEKDNVI